MARELCLNKSRNIVSPTGFCYSSEVSSGNPGFQTQFTNQIQEFDHNPAEIFNLTTTMEMVGFSKNLHQQSGSNSVLCKGISTKSNMGSSSSKTMNESSSFYDLDYNKQDFTSTSENLMVGVGPETEAWQENRFFLDDSSLRNNGFFAKADGMVGKVADLHQHGQFQPGNSEYLIPTQQLLNEFCSLEARYSDVTKKKGHKTKQWVEENATTFLRRQSLPSLDFIELQKRKTRLFSMMAELERRYRHYCDQMKMVVCSFEAVAGDGAANVYSALACKALSRHFRCLKDGIVTQIHAVKKAMGEKDEKVAAPGASKGETPRLRILDQTLRQQRAFQQMSFMESHPWRPQRGLPERSVSVLRAWLFEHFLHPYPSDVDKHVLARQTGLSRSQVTNWFINARVRLWKPMVEDMYLEEVKEQENTSDGGINMDNNGRTRPEDQKPVADQLLRINSDCLSSIINNPPKNNSKPPKTMQTHHQQEQNFSSLGAMELDFSSYNHHSAGAAHNFNGGGGVSLTLGLQQDGGNGSVSLAFSASPETNSLFFPRDSIEEGQPVIHYSLLDGEAQTLPYRNLMGAQMLHDMAG